MIEISRVDEPTPEIAEHLGRIMPFLSEGHDGSPIDLEYLRKTVESPSSVQFIVSAKLPHESDVMKAISATYPIIGAATLSTLHGALGQKAWLEDIVVVPDARKFGVAQKLWDAMTEWRLENELYEMRFTSKPAKKRAHGFYKRNDCQEIATGLTTLFVHNIES